MQQSLTKNQIIELTITDITHEGDGVGHYDGMAVFVPMTAVGDIISARVLKALKSHAFAKIESMITPSTTRTDNTCNVYHRCGGCSLRHIDYAAECDIKQRWVLENLRRIGGIDFEADGITIDKFIPSPEPDAYRNKAQYPVRNINGEMQVGFFAKRSHDLIPVNDCKLQPVFFTNIIHTVIQVCKTSGISAYDEISHAGTLRHIFIRHAKVTNETMLCLVINAATLKHADKLVSEVKANCQTVTTIVLNENRAKTNVIFGDKTTVLHGSGYITDELCGVKCRISAESFYQVNHDATELLYKKALEYATPTKGDTLLDLYCGAGTIGLSMAAAVGRVIGVEVVAEAIADAESNARENQIANARWLTADAAKAAIKLKADGIKPDIIVLDPPRKGIDEELVQTIAQFAAKKVVYISCNSATLARDIKRLTEFGFALERVCAVDLFPRTGHVETVVALSRKKPDDVIHIDLDLSELDITSAESKATYEELKEYILKTNGFKVSSLYISQVKRKLGLEVGTNYNLSKNEDARVPQCPPEKEAAIVGALKYFGMV